MSDQVTTAFIQQYKAGWEHLVQQRGSKLRDCVRVESQVGKASFYDQVDATTVRKRTIRHGDSPYIPTPHARRQCVLVDYDWGDFVDNEDKIRTLNDPTNPYVVAGAYAMGRAMDQAIVDNFEGTAKTGEDGSTSLTFATGLTAGSTEEGATIVHGGTGLNLTKLLQAKEILDDNEVDEDEERFIACTAAQITELLNTTEIKSDDYNTVKALAAGKFDTFLGFKFKRISSDILTVDATPTRNVLCWAKSGMLLAIGKDTTARITEREDKGFSTYVFNSMSIGATRMQGKKTIIIECSE